MSLDPDPGLERQQRHEVVDGQRRQRLRIMPERQQSLAAPRWQACGDIGGEFCLQEWLSLRASPAVPQREANFLAWCR